MPLVFMMLEFYFQFFYKYEMVLREWDLKRLCTVGVLSI